MLVTLVNQLCTVWNRLAFTDTFCFLSWWKWPAGTVCPALSLFQLLFLHACTDFVE